MQNNDYKNKLSAFYGTNNRMPTYSEMMKIFGFKSKNAVSRLVDKLLEAGLVEKDHLGRMVPTSTFSETPLLGLVKAGFPSDVDEMVETTINLNNFLINKKDKTYILEVDGKSMIDAHIDDGDMVIAERTETARDGDIVIAEVDGEFTMKFFRKTGTKVWLEPANRDFKNIYPERSLKIVAIVKGVVRKY